MSFPVSANPFRPYVPIVSPINNIEGRIDTPEAFIEYLKGMTFSFVETFARDLKKNQTISKELWQYIVNICLDSNFIREISDKGFNERIKSALKCADLFLKDQKPQINIKVDELAEKMLCYLDFIDLLSEYDPQKGAFDGIETIRNKFKESFPNYSLIELEKITVKKFPYVFQNSIRKIKDPSSVDVQKEAEIALVVNELGCQIFKKISNNQDNVAFSPISTLGLLQSILVALPEEKGKKFLQEIGLKLSPASKEANAAITEFFNGIMECLGDRGTLQIVNAAITKQIPSRDFEGAFQGKVFVFGREVNITTAANAYIEESTHKMIRNFFTDIQPNIEALLVNTVYFKASWEHSFKKGPTMPFNYIGYDPSIHPTPPEVRMMRKSENILCYDATDLGPANHTMVVLHYAFDQSRKSSLIAMMPENAANFDDLKKQLTPEFISKSSKGAKDFLKNSSLLFPKINLEKTTQLKPILEEHGYSSVNDHLDNLFKGATLNQMIQKVHIKVDEEGTEATAATIGAKMRSVMFPKREIVFDRPFIFMIYVDSVQLFCGQVVDATCLERPFQIGSWRRA